MYALIEDGVIISKHRIWARAYDAWRCRLNKCIKQGIKFNCNFVDLTENRTVVNGVDHLLAYPRRKEN